MSNLPHTDDEGYLLNPQHWSPLLAEQLAQTERLELSKLHWAIIHFTRNFYLARQTMPKMRELITHLRQEAHYPEINSTAVHKLFPFGPAQQIAKISGLPKPIRCL